MKTNPLATTVQALLASGKGPFWRRMRAFPTIAKRFQEFAIPDTEENRRAYRDLLFTTRGLNKYISGVILFDETMRQKTERRPDHAGGAGAARRHPRHQGGRGRRAARPFHRGKNHPRPRRPAGTRLAAYRAARGPFHGNGAPSSRLVRAGPGQTAIAANARLLALYASLSQGGGLVPIVEPEVLMDGDHTIERCEEVTTDHILETVFAALVGSSRRAWNTWSSSRAWCSRGEDCPGRPIWRPWPRHRFAVSGGRCPPQSPESSFLSGGSGRRNRHSEAEGHLPGEIPAVETHLLLRPGAPDPLAQSLAGFSGADVAAQMALLRCAERNGQAVKRD